MTLSICNPITNEHGREMTPHGTLIFPAACYDDDIFHSPVPWHWHDELEIIHVTEGKLAVTIDTRKYILSNGDGIFINTSRLHAVDTYDNSPGTLHSIVFHPRLIGGSNDSVFFQKYLTPILSDTAYTELVLRSSEPWQREILLHLEQAWSFLAAEQDGYEFQVRDLLSQILYLIHRHHRTVFKAADEKSARDHERIKMMLSFIQQHFDMEITISQIAASASISVSECLRCFRNTIGLTPIQYLKQYRIQQAAELLDHSSAKISDIAHRCGFQEMSYFAKSFRQITSYSPSEYRKRESR